MSVALLPDAEALFIAWAKAHPALTDLIGGRVGTKLPASLPAVRVARIGDAPPQTWEDLADLQVDCYAEDQGAAMLLARTVVASLPDMAGLHAGGRVGSAWVSLGPIWQPEPEAGRARYLLQVSFTSYAA